MNECWKFFRYAEFSDTDKIINIFKDNTFNLIETLGEKIIYEVFKYSPAKSVSVTIRKPEIKFGDNNNCVEVSISKNNE